MTTQEREAIVSPATSLLVFDTSVNNYFYFIDNQWVPLSQWSSSASNDDIYIETGNVGIGTGSPAYKLDVNGSINTSALNINGTPFSAADLNPVSNGVAAITAYNDWNDYGNTGFYMGHNLVNQPPNLSGAHGWKYVTVIRHNDLYCVQYATDFSHKANWTRAKMAGTWGAWKRSVDYETREEIVTTNIRHDNYIAFMHKTSGTAQKIATEGVLVSNSYAPNIGSVPQHGIYSKGNIVSNGTITPTSDIRLKDNIIRIDSALVKVQQMEGVYFTRKDLRDKEKRYMGFVADHLLNVVPELVIVPENPEQMKSVNYSQTTALLVEAIKEQQVQIDELNLKIIQQKNQTEKLLQLLKTYQEEIGEVNGTLN